MAPASDSSGLCVSSVESCIRALRHISCETWGESLDHLAPLLSSAGDGRVSDLLWITAIGVQPGQTLMVFAVRRAADSTLPTSPIVCP